jgi:Fe-S cluster assembly protein SufD
MSALLDSLAMGFEGDAHRRALLDAALQAGLPGARNEAWKYTSLRALERRSFAAAPTAAPTIDPSLHESIPAPRLVFVNGRHDAELSRVGSLPPGLRLSAYGSADVDIVDAGDDVFERLNLALAEDGIDLHVAANARIEQPVHLVFVGTSTGVDVAWHSRHRVRLDHGAQLVVIEHHLADGEHANLGNAALEVSLAADAKLLHARVQDDSTRATLISRTEAELDASAEYQRVDLELGAALSRNVLNVRLQGEAARLSSHGVLLASGRRHVDTRLGIAHVGRDTTCDLVWRGLADGRGRAVFHGGIVIHAGADGSDARLSNKNLLLGDDAEIDTQPVLEIHADEVKAAHGATVGQRDPTALFYLRSRGLNEAQARQLLTAAFCREVVAGIDTPALRNALDAALDRALARLPTA